VTRRARASAAEPAREPTVEPAPRTAAEPLRRPEPVRPPAPRREGEPVSAGKAAVTDGRGPQAQPPALDDRSLYFNRELSWLDFNDRVLELAEDERFPLLERVKFCAIYASNLDEFYMVRVAGLHEKVEAGIERPGPDGLTPVQSLARIRERVLELNERLTACLERELRPRLADEGVSLTALEDLDRAERDELSERFQSQIFPALTPLAVGPGRPFPYISNLSLSLAVLVRDPGTEHVAFARVKVPKEILPRFVELADGSKFVALEEVIADNLESLFPGMEIVDYSFFRVTRDADLAVSDEASDLLQAVENELRRRRFGEVVRVEVGAAMSETLRHELSEALGLDSDQVYSVGGLLDLTDLWQIVRVPGHAELREPPWTAVTHPGLPIDDDGRTDVMAAMREGDVLVHHPYESFASSVERFVQQAVEDPQVLAIKMTVYRTSDDSPLVPALITATERGKQAVCLVELKARFDERMNIQWAKRMEEAGVHVVYGQPSLKVHAKCVLVARREGDGVRHYVHVGTGNYHSTTARLYTDFGLFTTDPEVGADVADMFNYLTGYGRPYGYRKVLVAPNHLRASILEEVERTIEAHSTETPSRIVMKMNALVDQRCIEALYRASQAGVQVDLNVRGICCLRPGVPGVSEHIRVVSVLGRFLEHSRVFAFERGGKTTVYMSSADLMPRNLDTRVELAVPVEPQALREELLDVVARCLVDNTHAWELGVDGEWTRRTPGDAQPRDVQAELMEFHTERALELASARPPRPSREFG
jgi:polyphosphate kinase